MEFRLLWAGVWIFSKIYAIQSFGVRLKLPGYIKAEAFSIKDALFFELVLIGSRLGLMTFHKMSPRTHHNLLLITKSL